MLARQIEELNIHTAPTLSRSRTKVNSITHDCPPLSLSHARARTRETASTLSHRSPPSSFHRLMKQLGQFYAYWYVNTDQAVEALRP